VKSNALEKRKHFIAAKLFTHSWKRPHNIFCDQHPQLSGHTVTQR